MMELAPGAAAAGVGLIACETIGSTNAEALSYARAGEKGPLWITAREQTAGRGRRGRTWVSQRGNLFATLLLTDPAPPERAAQLSFVAALAVHDAIAARAPALARRLAFKWPNDVLLARVPAKWTPVRRQGHAPMDDSGTPPDSAGTGGVLEGAKVAGILIEAEGTRPLMAAVGIGINCRHHPAATDYPATDLAQEGAAVTVEELFKALSIAMVDRLREWEAGFASIRAAWLGLAGALGGELRVRLGARDLTGRFETLDEAGRLMLRLADGTIETIAAGEVFPVAPATTAVGR